MPDTSMLRDAELINLAFRSRRRGPRRALGQRLEAALERPVRYYAYIVPCEPSELTQATAERLFREDWRLLRAFDPKAGSLDTYLTAIVRNVARRFREKTRSKTWKASSPAVAPIDFDNLVGTTGNRPADLIDARSILATLRSRLDAHPRALIVFEMHFCDGTSPAEVADDLGWSRQVVYNMVALIRREAKDILREQQPD